MSKPVDALKPAAEAALRNAYAPYSRFRVGAALLSATGHIHTGCNVENGSYGLALCAERAAIARAVGDEGPGFRIAAVFIAARNEAGEDAPCPPCGACRQVITEFADENTPVIYNTRDGLKHTTIGRLLPDRFEL